MPVGAMIYTLCLDKPVLAQQGSLGHSTGIPPKRGGLMVLAPALDLKNPLRGGLLILSSSSQSIISPAFRQFQQLE